MFIILVLVTVVGLCQPQCVSVGSSIICLMPQKMLCIVCLIGPQPERREIQRIMGSLILKVEES